MAVSGAGLLPVTGAFAKADPLLDGAPIESSPAIQAMLERSQANKAKYDSDRCDPPLT